MIVGMRIGVAGAGLIVRKQVELIETSPGFLAVIGRRETPLISVEDAPGTLAVVEAVREAARTGACVSPRQITEQTA
jgi:ribosomal protein S12 methylthiotransferase accessory factor YcaO